jgi:biofilm PGA synthesis N-glycosyltransferase PgaC
MFVFRLKLSNLQIVQTHNQLDFYIDNIPLALLIICGLFQLYYYLFVFTKLTNYKTVDFVKSDYPSISVIVSARNESENLKKLVPQLFKQNYPNFEVVIVNDCSHDDSEDVLKELKKVYQNLKIVTVEENPRYRTSKKFAVTMGIKAASSEILVFTDADCSPASEFWLKQIVNGLEDPETEIVLGYSPYYKYSSLINILIRYETFLTALNYLSFAMKGMPYMGVGRNLAYKKSLFFKNKGFASHMHIPSGDDDLFVNQNANSTNTSVVFNKESQVWSEPNTTWTAFWKQKMRHLGAGKMYKKSHQRVLVLQVITAVTFYVVLVISLTARLNLYVISGVLLIKIIVQHLVYYESLKKLSNKDLIWWLIILDPFYYIYLSSLNIAKVFTKKVIWK